MFGCMFLFCKHELYVLAIFTILQSSGTEFHYSSGES